MTSGRFDGRKLPVWDRRRQAIEPFGGGRVAGRGGFLEPVARLGVVVGDAPAPEAQ